jgi:hypothetical protein
MRNRYRNPAQRLRTTVERLPERTRRAMLLGLERNRIIVGAYTDPRSGGICPMLAAHRNGGRTDLASFAIAWDAFTNARRPRLATRREIRTLRSFLEFSLLESAPATGGSIADAAGRIRAERELMADRLATARAAAAARVRMADSQSDANPEPVEAPARMPSPRREPRPTRERHRGAELRARLRWAWLRPTRRLDEFKDLVAAAEEQLSEQRAQELLGTTAAGPAEAVHGVAEREPAAPTRG